MTFRELIEIAPRDERFRATVYAMNSLMIKKGFYTEREFEMTVGAYLEGKIISPTPRQAIKQELHDICRMVQEFYSVDCELTSEGNYQPLCFARQVACYVAKNSISASLPQIAKYFSQHHSTVMHSCSRIAERRLSSPELTEFTNQLIRTVKSGTRKMPVLEATEPLQAIAAQAGA